MLSPPCTRDAHLPWRATVMGQSVRQFTRQRHRRKARIPVGVFPQLRAALLATTCALRLPGQFTHRQQQRIDRGARILRIQSCRAFEFVSRGLRFAGQRVCHAEVVRCARVVRRLGSDIPPETAFVLVHAITQQGARSPTGSPATGLQSILRGAAVPPGAATSRPTPVPANHAGPMMARYSCRSLARSSRAISEFVGASQR